jgi:ribonucleoside-diphosphate reductase alpha chain
MNMISATPSRPIGATLPAISQQIWDEKYRLKAPDGEPIDLTVEDSWRRVARAVAMGESDPAQWEETFYSALEDFKFLPGGRILAGAGVSRRVTLFNCFVMGTIEDDVDAIFSHLREAALTMQHGGGIGYDFSTLRPKGALVKGVGADASGPLAGSIIASSKRRTSKVRSAIRRAASDASLRLQAPRATMTSGARTLFLDPCSVSAPSTSYPRKREGRQRTISVAIRLFGNRGRSSFARARSRSARAR